MKNLAFFLMALLAMFLLIPLLERAEAMGPSSGSYLEKLYGRVQTQKRQLVSDLPEAQEVNRLRTTVLELQITNDKLDEENERLRNNVNVKRVEDIRSKCLIALQTRDRKYIIQHMQHLLRSEYILKSMPIDNSVVDDYLSMISEELMSVGITSSDVDVFMSVSAIDSDAIEALLIRGGVLSGE